MICQIFSRKIHLLDKYYWTTTISHILFWVLGKLWIRQITRASQYEADKNEEWIFQELFGRKCLFFFCQASEAPSDSVAWFWELLPWSPEKQIGAVRLAQALVSKRLGGDTLWSYFVHIKHGYTAMYTAKHMASRGPSWCLCSLSLLLALGQVTWSRGKTGRGNKSVEPGGVLQEGSSDQVGWWGAQMQRPRKGPRAGHGKEHPQCRMVQLRWETGGSLEKWDTGSPYDISNPVLVTDSRHMSTRKPSSIHHSPKVETD